MVTILAEPPTHDPSASSAIGFPSSVELPGGLIGFPELTHFDLLPADDHGPFFWLRPRHGENSGAGFLLLDPSGWMPSYRLEIFDEDAEWLSIGVKTHPWVFNIVTLPPAAPEQATVNLLGPLIVRRCDGIGKQVILVNHQRYSAKQPLTGAQGR